MLAKVGIAIAAPFLLTAIFIGATGVVVVDVKEGGPDGHHFVIPVPLVVAQVALSFAPEEAKYVECPEFAPYRDLALRILEELESIPDAVLVEVKDGGEHVLIRKEGNNLRVNVVDGADTVVDCKVPLKMAKKIIRDYDGTGFHTMAAIKGLGRASMGTLVHVQDGEDVVKVRMF